MMKLSSCELFVGIVMHGSYASAFKPLLSKNVHIMFELMI